MNVQMDALKARFLVVSVLFLASACVIQSAGEPKGDEAVQPAAPAAQVAPEKAETAVAKTPAAKPQAKSIPAPAKTAAKPTTAPAKAAAKVEGKGEAPAKVLAKTETPAKAGAKLESAPVKFTRVSRYVSVDNLNVRSRADQNAPIVGRLARGSMITVSVDGTWAKIGDSQFVSVKHLSKQQVQPKRLVSRK